VGKVLGTLRDPPKEGYLLSYVYDCDQTNVGLLIRYKCPDVVGRTSLVMHAFRRDRFCYALLPFDYLCIF
jgi:hypothetical protein